MPTMRFLRRAVAALVVAILALVGAHAAQGATGVAKTVQIKDFEFMPKRVTIKAGQRIRWVNRDFANHSVTFSKRKLIGSLSQNRSGTLRFTKPGTYRYICDFHPGMRGIVVVKR